MADYSDYPGGKNYESPGDRIGRAYMEHAGNTLDHRGEIPAKKLATEAVDEKPEQWNTEWDQAYELGLKHGREREAEKWEERLERLIREVKEW